MFARKKQASLEIWVQRRLIPLASIWTPFSCAEPSRSIILFIIIMYIIIFYQTPFSCAELSRSIILLFIIMYIVIFIKHHLVAPNDRAVFM